MKKCATFKSQPKGIYVDDVFEEFEVKTSGTRLTGVQHVIRGELGKVYNALKDFVTEKLEHSEKLHTVPVASSFVSEVLHGHKEPVKKQL